jgi:hypothetical protein
VLGIRLTVSKHEAVLPGSLLPDWDPVLGIRLTVPKHEACCRAASCLRSGS